MTLDSFVSSEVQLLSDVTRISRAVDILLSISSTTVRHGLGVPYKFLMTLTP